MKTYQDFINTKTHLADASGFEPVWMPDFLYDFQKELTAFQIRQGRGALFEDCGLGKTPQQLVVAENIVRKTGGKVLIIAPLAVSLQTVHEGEKFGIEVKRSKDGTAHPGITITNYESIEKFNSSDFIGCICDESSALKHFTSKRQGLVTEFMRKLQYRFLFTATPAPNDYIELGTSSEALGHLGRMDMLARFFKNDQNCLNPQRNFFGSEWRLKPHAERLFWQWVCSWARALRKPSDMGFDDGQFKLKPLEVAEYVVDNDEPLPGFLLKLPARGLKEQRDERRITVERRCEKVAELAQGHDFSIAWCNLNDEGDLLEKLIPDCVQVSGKDSDDAKEEKILAFVQGQVKRLVTKAKICGFGLNLQHCAHMTVFPSHSFEEYYQLVRRCHRFGQKRTVKVSIVASDGECNVKANLQRKERKAAEMFESLILHMNDALAVSRGSVGTIKERVPAWLS